MMMIRGNTRILIPIKPGLSLKTILLVTVPRRRFYRSFCSFVCVLLNNFTGGCSKAAFLSQFLFVCVCSVKQFYWWLFQGGVSIAVSLRLCTVAVPRRRFYRSFSSFVCVLFSTKCCFMSLYVIRPLSCALKWLRSGFLVFPVYPHINIWF